LEEIDFLFLGGTSGLPYGSKKTESGSDVEKCEPKQALHSEVVLQGAVDEHMEKNTAGERL
jgi:hypothetical protein